MKSAPLNSVTDTVANAVTVHGVNRAGQYAQTTTDDPEDGALRLEMQRGDPEALHATTENIRAIAALLAGGRVSGPAQTSGATFKPHQMGTAAARPADLLTGKAEALQRVYRRVLVADSISPSLRREFAGAVAALLRVAQPHIGAIGAVVADEVAEKLLGDLDDYREAVAAQVAAEAGCVN